MILRALVADHSFVASDYDALMLAPAVSAAGLDLRPAAEISEIRVLLGRFMRPAGEVHL
jgi:hypothetical protein